jgi:hypothetical protein
MICKWHPLFISRYARSNHRSKRVSHFNQEYNGSSQLQNTGEIAHVAKETLTERLFNVKASSGWFYPQQSISDYIINYSALV